jgi:serine/threonine-protein kinase
MLAGHPPFGGSNAFEIAVKHVCHAPPPLESLRDDLPPALVAVVNKLMAKKPHARYPSARDLLKDLNRLRDSLNAASGFVPVESGVTGVVRAEEPAPERGRSGWPVWGVALVTAAALGMVALISAAVVIGFRQRPALADGGPAAAPTTAPDRGSAAIVHADREQSLRKAVDQHLKDLAPNPAGVEDCIDLGVLYLEQNKVGEAAALFQRMDERRPPSAYHYIGHLGLAVTDALKKNYRASHHKLAELFDLKSKDNRAQVLNDYLTKNPEFAKWVNEADRHNVRNGTPELSFPKWWERHGHGKPPSRKP